jgi:iron(III) transport system substrate-binding protein
MFSGFRFVFTLLLVFQLCGGCRQKDSAAAGTPSGGTVTLYTSVDEPFVRPLIERFEQQTGVTVKLLTDGEAAKTVGLSERVIAEKDHPQGDVYWGNEPFHTISMAEQGVFTPYTSPAGADIRKRWQNKDSLYQTIGLRARMIVVSTRSENGAIVSQIHSVKDLANPALKGKIGMANPAFGTTSGQVAAWYLNWGDGPTDDFLRSLKANQISLLGGNSNVVDKVADGSLIAGFTDNDDIANGKADSQKIDAITIDADSNDALLIPTTIAQVKNCPHPDAASKLIDFLMDAGVEHQLIDAHFLAFSARDAAVDTKSMDVNYIEVAHRMPAGVRRALDILR